jgi:hypothetical protein
MRERNAAQMRADADQHLPLVVTFLDALLIGLGIRQAREIDVARLLDFFFRAVADENRLAAPEYLDHLAFGDGRQIDLDRRTGSNGRGVRIHLRNQRHKYSRGADRAEC